MKKYQIIFILFVVIFYLLFNYFTFESLRKEREAFLSDINISLIDLDKELFQNNTLLGEVAFSFWDMEESLILKNRIKNLLKVEDKKSDETVENKEKVNLKNRTVCLGKKCWEFLGIITINNETVVTLLSTEAKSKLETFHVNDMLVENLKIIKIKGDELLLEEQTDKENFTLKLFNVNMEKYIPKKLVKEKND